MYMKNLKNPTRQMLFFEINKLTSVKAYQSRDETDDSNTIHRKSS